MVTIPKLLAPFKRKNTECNKHYKEFSTQAIGVFIYLFKELGYFLTKHYAAKTIGTSKEYFS